MEKWYSVILPAGFWDAYWGAVSIEENLELCRGDGILSVLQRYVRHDQMILEAGCGLAKWVISFHAQGYRIIGLDNHSASIKRVKAYGRELRVMLGSVTELPFHDDSIDIYVSLGVLEHFEEGPARPLREAYRILKPGGIAIVETPLNNVLRRLAANRLWRAVMMLKKMTGHQYRFAEYRLTANELMGHIRGAGFSILEVRPKDYAQTDKSIGLYMDIPIFRKKKGKLFELNVLGKLTKSMLNRLSPWISSACIVCVAAKGVSR